MVKTQTLGAPKKSIQDLLDHEPVAPPEAVEKAGEVIQKARFKLATTNAVIETMIIEKATVGRLIPTTAIDTMAVTIGGDGFTMLLYNPEFTADIGPEGACFVLCHEAGHLMCKHLYMDSHLNGQPLWTLACEATINAWVLKITGLEMPRSSKTGEESGVNPYKVWESYKADLRKQGKDPVGYDQFISTDLTCYAELSRMTKPPRNKGRCVHQDESSGGSGSGEGDGPVQIDQEAADNIMEEILDAAMTAAQGDQGSERHRDELIALEGRTKGSEKAEKVWGNMGLAALRGEPVQTRKVSYWEQWVRTKMAERLEEGMRLRVLRKTIGLTPEPQLRYRGDEYFKSGVVAIDTSGSMYAEVLDFIQRQVGEEEGLRMEYWNFDAALYPVTEGDPFKGGGGTSFAPIMDYVENEMEEPPDFVIVVTDGFAAPIQPRDPERWVWLIVDSPFGGEGNDWPSKSNPVMDSMRLTAEDMAITRP